jgi:hypothetical protein
MKLKAFSIGCCIALSIGSVGGLVFADQSAPDFNASSRQEVEQKMTMAKQMLYSSSGVKRLEGGGDSSTHQAARLILNEARVLLDSARVAFDNKFLKEADDLAGEAMRQAGVAFRLQPDPARILQQEKSRYAHLQEEIRTFLDSKMVTSASSSPPELEQIRESMKKAQTLADKGSFVEANELLAKARKSINATISKLMVSKTVSYEVKFDSPKDEFEYEMHRHQSIVDLLPLAVAEYKPSKETLKEVDVAMERVKQLQTAAEKLAAGGDFKAAMRTLKQSTNEVYSAMELVGLVVPR